jgi:hypothetical protein
MSATKISVSLGASGGGYTSASASLTVTAALDHIVISPGAASITAGVSQDYSAEAFDQYGNSLGSVTATYRARGASITGNSVSATAAGSYTVTGTYRGKSADATLTVTHAAAASSVAISPAGSSVTAGLSKTYSATASDAYGNTWDVTGSVTWSISSGAGGSWSSNVYTSAKAGSYTVTGTYNSAAYTTGLTVNLAGLDHFVFNTVGAQTAGASFSLTVTAVDAYGNTVSSYTGTNTLSVSTGTISPTSTGAFSNGVWTGMVTVTAAGSGVTITATDGSYSGASDPFTVNPTLTASAESHGSITPSGAAIVNYGSDQTFIITPDAHYHVADVLVDGSSVGAVTSYTFTNVVAAHRITATFAINTFTITAVAGANGTISPSGSVSINYGANQSFTVTASTGYHIADFMVNGTSVLGSAVDGKYTVSDVTEDTMISVSFAVNTYSVTVNVGTNGSSNLASQTVNWNSTLDFVFTPDAGYHVSNVLVNGTSVGTANSLSITVTEDTSVGVSFAIDTFAITVTQGANGLITGPSSVNYGAYTAFTIVPSTGYHIVDVVVDGASKGAVSSYTISNVQAAHMITAIFAINTYTLTVTQSANGVIAPGTTTVNYGSSQSFTITANAGYHVVDVVVDSVSQGAVSSHTFTNVQAAHMITATFAISTFIISASAGANGTISPSGSVSINYGASQTLTITPNANHHVADVLVDGSSVGAVTSYTFTNVVAAHRITATFAINTFTITAVAGANGTISPSGSVSINYGANQSFTVTASAGYHIDDVVVDSVSQGVVSSHTVTNVQVDFTNLQASHMITAFFAINIT